MTRTIPWETIADWYKENEQAIHDVMKFEGLRGAVNEVLRLAPEQSELAALREELATMQREFEIGQQNWVEGMQRLTAAEQRNATLSQQASKAFESAARWVESRRDDYVNDHGSIDPETGTVEFPGNGEEYVGELDEIAEGLRSLKPTESGSSALSRKISDTYQSANVSGMLSGVTYTNTKDCAAMVGVYGGTLFVNGHEVPSPCLLPPGSTTRAERGPEYTNFFAAMYYVTVTDLPSIENWVEVKR